MAFGNFFNDIWNVIGTAAIGILFVVMILIFGAKFVGQQKADILADPDLGNESTAYDAAVQGEEGLGDLNESLPTLVGVVVIIIVVAGLLMLRNMNN